MWIGYWPFPMLRVISPVQTGLVAPDQCLEWTVVVEGCRNCMLHPLCFLSIKEVQSEQSFCVPGV